MIFSGPEARIGRGVAAGVACFVGLTACAGFPGVRISHPGPEYGSQSGTGSTPDRPSNNRTLQLRHETFSTINEYGAGTFDVSAQQIGFMTIATRDYIMEIGDITCINGNLTAHKRINVNGSYRSSTIVAPASDQSVQAPLCAGNDISTLSALDYYDALNRFI